VDQQRLRVKIGVHEFEAEGPPDVVAEQFQAWRELIAEQPSTRPDQQLDAGGDPDRHRDTSTVGELPSIFSYDRKRELLSLSVHPRGNRRHADAALLLVYGYKLLGRDEVIVGTLKEALAVSGLKVDRVDRIIVPYVTANLVLKGGSGKGGKYRLTNLGIDRAKELIDDLGGT
jgi:hypothetical protein